MEKYNYIYHYNTYTKLFGAMTVESVAAYFSGGAGDYVTGKTREIARETLTKKLTN
jgi:hypothetical protein